MKLNIIKEYTNYVEKELHTFFSIVFPNEYKRKDLKPFISKYIDVRYYNECVITKKSSPTDRIAEELEKIYLETKTPENEEFLKNVYSIFTLILYIDEVERKKSPQEMVDYFFKNDNIKINYDKDMNKKISSWLKKYIAGKEKFKNILSSKVFTAKETKLKEKYYCLKINTDYDIPAIYSKEIIQSTEEMDIIKEDMFIIMLIKASEAILNNAIDSKFDKNYILTFPETIWDKPKKITRILNIMDNLLCKKFIQMKIELKDTEERLEDIKNLVKEGYQFAVDIKDENIDINDLVLFETIYINNTNKNKSSILNNANKLKINTITRD